MMRTNKVWIAIACLVVLVTFFGPIIYAATR